MIYDYDTACRLRAVAQKSNDPDKWLAAEQAFEFLQMPATAESMANRRRYYEKERPAGWQTIALRPPCPGGHDYGGIWFCQACGVVRV